MSNKGIWHKHKDWQRGGWNVYDEYNNFVCHYVYDFEAQARCNAENGVMTNAESK